MTQREVERLREGLRAVIAMTGNVDVRRVAQRALAAVDAADGPRLCGEHGECSMNGANCWPEERRRGERRKRDLGCLYRGGKWWTPEDGFQAGSPRRTRGHDRRRPAVEGAIKGWVYHVGHDVEVTLYRTPWHAPRPGAIPATLIFHRPAGGTE